MFRDRTGTLVLHAFLSASQIGRVSKTTLAKKIGRDEVSLSRPAICEIKCCKSPANIKILSKKKFTEKMIPENVFCFDSRNKKMVQLLQIEQSLIKKFNV